jgi:NitT/TauT family transport system substrate-binding protein
MQHHPYGLMSHAAHPVKTFADLRGRTVTAFAGATWITMVKQQTGVDFGLAPLTTSIAGFMADREKRAIEQIFVTNEPYFARNKGADIHVLRIGESGWDPYRVIFTTRDFAAKHPDVVRRFVRASRQGWHDYLHGDAAAADASIRKKNPTMTQDYIDFVRQTLIETRLVTGLRDQGQMALDFAKLEADLASLRQAGLIKTPLAVGDIATGEFLPAP